MNSQSFQLIRTNPRLTTNIKIVVASDYNLYLESFNSCSDLSKNKYKHYLLKTDSMYEYDFPKFYDGLSKTLAYTPYTFNDVHIMYNRYENQFDEMYFSGADEVEDNWYDEEFEYFAPLYVVKNQLPSNFIIMRVDDPVIYKKTGSDYTIDDLRNDNFKEEIIDKWKCVTVFDLSDNTNIGKFLKRNIDDNSRFPDYSLFFDIKYNNFIKYAGMKYSDGIYTVSNENMSDKLEKQNTHYDLEDFITKGFERNNIVYPYILNLKFLYNDTPATPDKLLTYSMNRYYGFYTDSLELIKTITTYDLPDLKTDVIIRNNIFLNLKGEYTVPFKTNTDDSEWIQYGDELYEVRKQANGSYKIISDIDLSGKDISEFNKGKTQIKNNKINFNNSKCVIDKYIDKDGNEELMFADLYLIEIDGLYHVLKNDYIKNNNSSEEFLNNYKIHCDYNISSDTNILEYYKGGKIINYNDKENIYNDDIKVIYEQDMLSNINTLNYYNRTKTIYKSKEVFNKKPLLYKIYRVNFSDIKDFDYDRLNTSYSDYQYEKSYYTETVEEKLDVIEYRDKSNPKKYKLNRENEDGQYKKMIVSSEYISDGDLYEITDNVLNNQKTLNSMWNKTQTINKWVYKDSLSHCDYPYKLNNSFEVGGVYNRGVNTDLNIANISQNNLEYFYRIGEFYGVDEVKIIDTLSDDLFDIIGDTTKYNLSNGELSTNFGINSNTTVLLKYKGKLEKNEDYFVKYTINMSNGIQLNNVFVGFTTDTFENQHLKYKINNEITISFFARLLGDELKFEITNFSNLRIKDFSVTKVNKKHYYNQTSNIQTSLLNKYNLGDNDNRFNIDYYINSDIDYFDYFFNNIMYYEDYGKLKIKPYTKYSIFNGGTTSLPSKTLFNGIEYELYSVKDMILGDSINSKEKINTIIEDGGLKYNGYKLSVILSENYNYYKFKYIKDTQGKRPINYTNPTYLYNYNSSIKGLIENQDKNAVHIYLNDKFKNILIVVNQNIPFNYDWLSLNNIDLFGENYGIYFSKTKDNLYPISGGDGVKKYNPNNIVASNYIKTINNINETITMDTNIYYHYIDVDGNYASTLMTYFDNTSTFNSLPNWVNKFPPFLLKTITSDTLSMYRKPYDVEIYNGPSKNIKDMYLINKKGIPIKDILTNEVFATKIKRNPINKRTGYKNKINRYSGYYEPLTRNIPIFTPTYYWVEEIEENDTIVRKYKSYKGNYKFHTELEEFGIIKEIMYSKVNEDNYVLKLKNVNELSLYPILDEVGLSQTSRNIFSSPWDKDFYLRTINDFISSDNTHSEKIIENIIIEGGFIADVNVEIPNMVYFKGVNIYGKNHSGNKLKYNISIKNISAGNKKFKYITKYQSSQKTYTIKEEETNLIIPNGYYNIPLQLDRPEELNNTINNEEFTKWYFIIELYDVDTNKLYDFNNKIMFNVYNDKINFELLNPTSTKGFNNNSPYYVEQKYNFGITLKETHNLLKNIPYTINLLIEKKKNSDEYEIIKSYKDYINKNTNEKIINFNDIIIPINKLEYNNNEDRKIKFEVLHYYDIGGNKETINNTYDMFDENEHLKILVNRPQENPKLVYSQIPTLTIMEGVCDENGYTGDMFAASVVISNLGGYFAGDVKVLFSLRENSTIIETKSITETLLLNNGGNSGTIFKNITFGPLKTNGEKIISYSYKDYDVIVSTSYISGHVRSDYIKGFNDTEPTC